MHYYLLFCAVLGSSVAILVIGLLVGDLIRTARQSYRIAYVLEHIRGNRGVTARMWWHSFRYEWTTRYNYLLIGAFKIPRDYREKIRRQW